MTTFQLVAAGLFVVAAVATYKNVIVAAVKAGVRKLGTAGAAVATVAPAVRTSDELVRDLMMVSNLRDRLSSKNCKDGVDACTVLLRIMIESK